MRERPILFSAPMVRAIMAGRKTQTRRIVAPQQPKPSTMNPYDLELTERDGSVTCYTLDQFAKTCRYGQPGDRLWVKETHAFYQPDPGLFLYGKLETLGIRKYGGGAPIHPGDLRVSTTDAMVIYAAHPTTYKELPAWPGYDTYSPHQPERWRPSIFMPRWASRITLEIAKVRVERLHEITEDGARAEGCTGYPGAVDATPREEFEELWKDINGLDSWRANPWVWVIEFVPVDGRKKPATVAEFANDSASAAR